MVVKATCRDKTSSETGYRNALDSVWNMDRGRKKRPMLATWSWVSWVPTLNPDRTQVGQPREVLIHSF